MTRTIPAIPIWGSFDFIRLHSTPIRKASYINRPTSLFQQQPWNHDMVEDDLMKEVLNLYMQTSFHPHTSDIDIDKALEEKIKPGETSSERGTAITLPVLAIDVDQERRAATPTL
ncbi:hypothetical protein BPOR_0157g00080 [Botrytis porri]|uniref:Uncharacterized protein n=1 Tax=Botrytis porri TaxID=87229 RepID=A0A4Z1KVP8_9HELO|nr:hypothetical protein BPOR_0157g00080 [Botrytis porri]